MGGGEEVETLNGIIYKAIKITTKSIFKCHVEAPPGLSQAVR